LANPGKLANVFWLDDDLESRMYLDAIVTVVDAKNVERHLNVKGSHTGDSTIKTNEATVQVAYADTILLNKTDLVEKNDTKRVGDRLRAINKDAKIMLTQKSRVDLDEILDLRAFDRKRIASQIKMYEVDEREEEKSSHDDDDHHHHHQNHVELNNVTTVCIRDDKNALDLRKFQMWMANILWENDDEDDEEKSSSPKMDIFRAKGILNIHGAEEMYIFQAVHENFECDPVEKWKKGETRETKIIFIGKGLSEKRLQHEFQSALFSAFLKYIDKYYAFIQTSLEVVTIFFSLLFLLYNKYAYNKYELANFPHMVSGFLSQQGQKLEKEREREREREYDDKGEHNHKVLSDRSVLECGEDGSVVDSDDPDDLRFEQLVRFRDRSVQIRVQHRVVSVLSVDRCADGERYEG